MLCWPPLPVRTHSQSVSPLVPLRQDLFGELRIYLDFCSSLDLYELRSILFNIMINVVYIVDIFLKLSFIFDIIIGIIRVDAIW